MTRPSTSAAVTASIVGALIVTAWVSAGTAPLREAIAGAVAPSDFGTDFVPAARLWTGPPAAARREQAHAGSIDVRTGNAEAARVGAPPYADVGVPFGAHPPPAVLLVALLVPLGFPGAALAWLALSLGALAVVAWTAASAVTGSGSERTLAGGPRATTPTIRLPPLGVALALFLGLMAWPPVLHNLEKGQWSLLLAGLLAGAWWAHGRRRDRLAGTLIALAASFKIMPLLAVVAFAGRGADPARRRAVLLAAGITLVAVVLATAVVMGPRTWFEFARAAPLNTAGWQTGPANTLSLWGALARLLVGGPFATPLGVSRAATDGGASGTMVARLLWAAIATLLLIAASRRSTRGPRPASDPGHAYAAWCCLVVLLGPLSWTHTATMLVLPLALLTSTCGRLALAAALALLTIPRFALLDWAGPLPVAPGRGLLLSLHLAGALILFVVAVAPARSHPPDQPGGVA